MRVQIEGDIYLSSNGSDGTLGHYTTLAEAINHGLLRKKIAESSAGTLKELLAELELIRQEIMAAIQF